MWAGSILLRIGEQRDVLVAVQADSESSLDRLRILLGPWIEPEFADRAPIAKPAFGVRLEPVPDRDHHRTPGPRPVPQLRHGSKVVARSRTPDDIVHALAGVLGGAHLQRRDDGHLWIGMRPFVLGSAMVLVDAEHPTLVNDRQLAKAGIAELPAWSVVIEPDGTISVPPPLPHLEWDTAGIERPPDPATRFDLTGIVGLSNLQIADADFTAGLAQRSLQSRWSELVGSLGEAGRVIRVGDHPALRTGIRTLLEQTPADPT